MFKQRLLLVLIFSFLSSLCLAESSISRQFTKEFIKGMESGNSAPFVSFLSGDVKVLPEYDMSYIGTASAEQYFASIFALYDIQELKRSGIETIELGDKRLEIGSFALRYEHKASDKAYAETGNYFEIWDTRNNKLLTMSWNYDSAGESQWDRFRAQASRGIRYAFLPLAPIDDPVSFEVASQYQLVTTLMHRRQPETMAVRFAEDAWFAHHDRPLKKGKQQLTEQLIEYAKNWNSFDYIDVHPHDIYVHDEYVLEHMSYNLRWRAGHHSGIVTGKGIRLSKRNAEGVLQVYRSIAMHD
jgi:ketosteroid isomerase-like protein